MSAITVEDYRPSVDLDAEVAALVFEAVRGWPDQTAISAATVRSVLNPTGTAATTLVLHRSSAGDLDAMAAIRWPATLDSLGQVWGPLVHPSARGDGLARDLIDEVSRAVARRRGLRVRTAIPQSRTMGWELFERAGWQVCGTSSLLKRQLPAPELDDPATPPVAVRPARPGEFLDQALASLVAAARPDLGYATARDTFRRWSSDARYVPDGLLLAEEDSRLLGAALVYPPRSSQPTDGVYRRAADEIYEPPGQNEPPEALIVEVLTTPDLPAEVGGAVRSALVRAALAVGAHAGAVGARAEAECPYLCQTLLAAGFELADTIRYYAPPDVTSAAA